LRHLYKATQTSHSNIVEQVKSTDDITAIDNFNVKINTIGDAGALLAPLVMLMIITASLIWNTKLDTQQASEGAKDQLQTRSWSWWDYF
jgi:hypothetical protein